MSDRLSAVSTTADTAADLTSRKLRDAAVQFEAMFFELLLEQIPWNGNENGMLGEKDAGSDMVQSMIQTSLSQELATTGSLGIAELVYRQMAPSLGLDPEPVLARRGASDAYRRSNIEMRSGGRDARVEFLGSIAEEAE